MTERFKANDCEDTAVSVQIGIKGWSNVKERAASRHIAVVENEMLSFDNRVLSALALHALSRDSQHEEGHFGVFVKINRFFEKHAHNDTSSAWEILKLVSPGLSK